MKILHVIENVYVYKDTCNVYIIKRDREALLIDFGSGDVLDCLDSIGVRNVIGVLLTHHHRDQGQGLAKAAQKGIPIYVPCTEKDLFGQANEYWQARGIYVNYNVRQDRFSILESIPIAGVLNDYSSYDFGGIKITVIPTPGHTIGSITITMALGESGLNLAFTGDLIYAPGKVWTMSGFQWNYNGSEGAVLNVLSLLDLKDRHPDMLLPSHGEPMREPSKAIGLLTERLHHLLKLRKFDPDLIQLRNQPYERITPHLLMNNTAVSNSYVLLSESGKALIIDYGYDFRAGTHVIGPDRACWRPWMYSIGILKKQFNVSKVDVVIPTHYHDDHVAGINLLREVEGTQVWAGENFADVLEQPSRYNVPCLWYDPIPVSRRLPLERPFKWEEYEFTLYELPGHTLYAVTISFKIDGKQVIAIGDQYTNGDVPNYVYSNRYRAGDFIKSRELFMRIRPDLIIRGHKPPIWVESGSIEQLTIKGDIIDRIHEDLLPADDVNLGAEGFCARIYPYQLDVQKGGEYELEVEFENPLTRKETIEIRLVVPDSWIVDRRAAAMDVPGRASGKALFRVRIPDDAETQRRIRIAADITAGPVKLGQQAEALITIV